MAKSWLLSREVVFFADFLPTSGYFPGLCVSPAVVNALRLSSTPQFRSENTTDPTHAPTFRRSRGTWQKADLSLAKSAFADFLPASGYFPGLCVSPAVVSALRLSSPPQSRSANTADPTHALISVTGEEDGKKPASLSRSRFFSGFLPASGYIPWLCVSPAVVCSRGEIPSFV